MEREPFLFKDREKKDGKPGYVKKPKGHRGNKPARRERVRKNRYVPVPKNR